MGCARGAGIATGRAFIARGNENGDALCHGLLKRSVVCRVRRCAVICLALAVADAHDGGRCRLVDEVLEGNQTAKGSAGIAQDASSMAALGAAALAHSASRIASPSSPLTPGLLQLLAPLPGAGWTCVKEPEV